MHTTTFRCIPVRRCILYDSMMYFFVLCIYIESSFQSHHFFQDHLTCFLPGTLALDVFHHALQRFGPRNLANHLLRIFVRCFRVFPAIWEVLCNPICWKRIEQLNLPWLTSSLAKGFGCDSDTELRHLRGICDVKYIKEPPPEILLTFLASECLGLHINRPMLIGTSNRLFILAYFPVCAVQHRC